jgi:hypothetical protein
MVNGHVNNGSKFKVVYNFAIPKFKVASKPHETIIELS